MDKLEQLKNFVAELFNNATEKADIDNASKLKDLTDAVESENKALVEKNAELIKDYKSLVQHTSFSGENKPTDTVGGQEPNLEEILAQFIKK